MQGTLDCQKKLQLKQKERILEMTELNAVNAFLSIFTNEVRKNMLKNFNSANKL